MTSSDQTDREASQNDTADIRWTTRQTLGVTLTTLLSIVLWTLTPITHSVTGGWLSNLAWTMAATSTLGAVGLAWQIIGSHRDARRAQQDEARMRRLELLVKQVCGGQVRLYDRQEQLAGEIQAKQRADAEDMLVRQQEIVDRMTAGLEEHHKSLDGLRKRLGKLVALHEQRDATVRVRAADFEANAKALIERMEALALLIETRMPPRQLGYKRRDDGS